MFEKFKGLYSSHPHILFRSLPVHFHWSFIFLHHLFFNEKMLAISFCYLIFLACMQLQNLAQIEIRHEQWTIMSLTTLKTLYCSITTISFQADLRNLPELSRDRRFSQFVKRPQAHQTMACHLAVSTYMDIFSATVILSGYSSFTHHLHSKPQWV